MSKKIKIYGERNTGTNYLEKLLDLNLHVTQIQGIAPGNILKLQRLLPGKELIRDLYFQYSFNQNLGWKHSCINPHKLDNSPLFIEHQPAIITITKNPYAWLISLHHRPYHQHYQKKPDFKTFLQQPWGKVRRDNISVTLQNPIELWNHKNRSYIQDRFLNLTSESMIENPKNTIDRISQKFSIRKKNTYFTNYQQSTKEEKKDSHFYQEYYRNELWRNKLTNETIALINQHLDKSLLEHFGYALLKSPLE